MIPLLKPTAFFFYKNYCIIFIEKRIRFTNDMLDTVIDRFGTKSGATYLADGKSHFIVSADVEISNPFYSWICGFRKKATIISPPEAVDGMRKFLADIAARYEDEGK